MASSLPYAAPFARSAPKPKARPTMRLNSQFLRLLAAGLVIALIYVLVQLYLASIASAILHDLVRLESEIAVAEVERDGLLARVEELKSPAIIEMRARDLGYRPLTDIEFVR